MVARLCGRQAATAWFPSPTILSLAYGFSLGTRWYF